MRKRSYLFTDKTYSDQGKFSAALGLLVMVSLCIVIYSSYQMQGKMSAKLGAATLFSFVFAIIGEIVGILARLEKDKFYIFPNIGIILNTVGIVIIGVIIYLGVWGF